MYLFGRFLTSLLCFLFSMPLFAQNISGTINIYTAVNSILNPTTITVANSAGFAPGDKVLLIQMQGATINQTNTALFGTITGYGDAGNYEYNFVDAVNGNTITLFGSLCNTYTISGRVQLIRVPVYTNPTVTAPLTCQAWNGTTGGVLAFDATGTITFNSGINVAGQGFRGGAFATSYFDCAEASYAASSLTPVGGQKGEGIANYVPNLDGCRAPQANGGGGANRGNPGAGGGGNAGIGGRGGNVYNGCGGSTVWGMGGYGLTITGNKIFMGGGGGGGYRDNGQTVTPGANGGGIVMFSAAAVNGNNNTILANGASVNVVTNDEGAGGGGGGGAVYMWTSTINSPLNINVTGGTGGNTLNVVFTGNCHGPGGGGGGGYVYFQTGVVPPNALVNNAGGNSGLVLHNGPCTNQPFGAANGTAGANYFNLPPQPLPNPRPDIGPDTMFCAGAPYLITELTGFPYTTYLWSDGTNGVSTTGAQTGTYWLETDDGCGGVYRDSMNLTLFPGPPQQNDTSLCAGDSVLFSAGPNYVTYAWTGFNPNPGNVSFTYPSQTGIYGYQVTDVNGCIFTDSIEILALYPLPVVNLGPDVSLCQGSAAIFDAGPGFASYQWMNATTNQTLTTSQAGQVSVAVTDNNGCTGYDTAVVLQVFPLPMVNLGADTSICPGTQVLLDAGPGYALYQWSDNSSNQTLQTGTPGTYSVTVTDGNACTNSDTLVLNVYPAPQVNLGPDTSLCQGDQLIFTPGNGFVTYLWQDNSMNPTYTASAAGLYYVGVVDANGCIEADSVSILQLYPLPVVNLGPDQAICAGESVVLNAGNGFVSYLWQNNSGASTYTATQAGNYYVTVTDGNTCQNSDTFRITQVYPLPVFSLGVPQPLCPGNTLLLEPDNANFPQFSWNTGSNQPSLLVNDVGVYSLTITDANNCSNTRSVEVYFECPTTLYIPNSFTPNADGLNDLIMAFGTNIRGFRMDIFDRWGEQIYTIPNLTSGWDGIHNGKPVPIGHYVYLVTYVDYNSSEEHRVHGSFSLIR